MKVINSICHYRHATWHPITGKNNSVVVKRIKAALNDNCIVLFEQRNPIVDNGRVVKSNIRNQVRNKALRGNAKTAEQTNWFKTAVKAAGYVTVRKK